MQHRKQKRFNVVALLLAAVIFALCGTSAPVLAENIGVLYTLHGGMDEFLPQNLWDAGVQQFVYDPNHPVYKLVIWGALRVVRVRGPSRDAA